MDIINAINIGIGLGNAIIGLADAVSGLIEDDRNSFRSGIQGLTIGGIQAFAGYSGQPLPPADQVGWPSGPPPFYFPQPDPILPASIPAAMPQPVPQPLQSVPAEPMMHPGQGYIIVMPSQPQLPIMPVRY